MVTLQTIAWKEMSLCFYVRDLLHKTHTPYKAMDIFILQMSESAQGSCITQCPLMDRVT